MTHDAGRPPTPERYGAGLAVLVVGTGAEPFTDRAPADLDGAPVLLVDSGAAPPGGAAAVKIGEDVGRGAAVNRAVAGLPLEVGLVAVAPPGLVWAAGALAALRDAAGRHPRAGILGPGVCTPGGTSVPSAHALPRPGRGVVAVLGRGPWPPDDAADPGAEGPVGWSSAPALLLRRTALDSVDGFDPRYRGRLDDLDLADRLAVAGWLTVHVPAATATYDPVARPDAAAARRYLSDRTSRPVRALLRAASV